MENEAYIKQLALSIEEKNKAIRNVELDLAASRAEVATQLQKLDQLTEAYKEELLALSTELQGSTKAYEQASEKVTELEQYIERLSSEFDELASENSRLESELSTTKESAEKLEVDLTKAHASLADRVEEVATLSQRLQSLQEVCSDFHFTDCSSLLRV